MHSESILGVAGTSFMSVMTAAQTNETYQLIELIVTIIVGLVTVINIFVKWYKEAKKDGKITTDEVVDLLEKETDALKDEKSDSEDLSKENDNTSQNG